MPNLRNDRRALEQNPPTRRALLGAMGGAVIVTQAAGLRVANAAELPPFAEAKGAFRLPEPKTAGGMPVLDALKARRSTREYSDKPLPLQLVSDLLWAAFGVNRPEESLRTAPSTHGKSSIDIYLAFASGVWRYDAVIHSLVPHLGEDVRGATTTGQPFARIVPLNLIYVSNDARVGDVSEIDRQLYAIADAAVISQNVYLFCASAGLGTVMRGSVDGVGLARRLKLSSGQQIRLCQSVGYPAV